VTQHPARLISTIVGVIRCKLYANVRQRAVVPAALEFQDAKSSSAVERSDKSQVAWRVLGVVGGADTGHACHVAHAPQSNR
jgi:hypothetical protein